MKVIPYILLGGSLFVTCMTSAQATHSYQDTLRGSITAERAWWDLLYYHLDIAVDPVNKSIAGQNTIRYKTIQSHHLMQIDLQVPMVIDSITQDGHRLTHGSDGNAHFIHVPQSSAGAINELTVFYHGQPRIAQTPPWDGGITWQKDDEGFDFIASACQGLGASVWWPCKDHMYDEVDSMRISVEIPDHLTNVSNGRLLEVSTHPSKKTKTFHYLVRNPINNYGVNINIGNYASWQESYLGEKGNLDMTYHALKPDTTKAKNQFRQAPLTIAAFEHWFGPYPFYEDGYQLVQAPYLGMEHQSSVTYGNKFENGYLGTDLSQTGWGLKFDFIIVHESGHEWFANNVTHTDQADMWIHESFTNYSESLFLEYYFGKQAGQEYVRGTRINIDNIKPMIATYGVNADDYPLDVYYKGANVLNTLRTIVDDDKKWRELLRSINSHFYHQTINSAQLEQYIQAYLKLDLTSFFDQYLRDPRQPVLSYYIKDKQLHYKWIDVIPEFKMPVDVHFNNTSQRIVVSTKWAKTPIANVKEDQINIDPNYYITTVINSQN